MKVTAKVTRSGKWWAIEVPEVDGVFSQARTLAGVPAMVKDAVALMSDVPEESVEVEVVHVLPKRVENALEQAEVLYAEAAHTQKMAARTTRWAAKTLSDQGVSLRDIGALLGVSYQRAHQLVSATEADEEREKVGV